MDRIDLSVIMNDLFTYSLTKPGLVVPLNNLLMTEVLVDNVR